MGDQPDQAKRDPPRKIADFRDRNANFWAACALRSGLFMTTSRWLGFGSLLALIACSAAPGDALIDDARIDGDDPGESSEADLAGIGSNEEQMAVATNSLTFNAIADAEVSKAKPTTNLGTSNELGSDGDPQRRAFLRFNVSGVSGNVTRARVRCYATNGSVNAPAIYSTSNGWSESSITWNNQPAASGSALSDVGAIGFNAWVEFDVTKKVVANGSYDFVLIPTSTDSLVCNSREASSNKPQLVVTTETEAVVDPPPNPNPQPPVTPGVCPSFGSRVSRGTPGAPLVENSGLAASRKSANVIWGHNDSGAPEHVFAIDTRNGKILADWAVSEKENGDWEDIDVGPGPVAGTQYIYVGRIGSSAGQREIVRFPEPSVTAGQAMAKGQVSGAERFKYVYPGGVTPDAESMMVDPTNGDTYILTKNFQGHSKLYLYRAPLNAATTKTLEEVVSDIPFNPSSSVDNDRLAVSADIRADGREIIVKTYNQTYIWLRAEGQSVASAMQGTRCAVTNPGGSEAIAFAADGMGYYSLTEGAGSALQYVPRK